MTASDAAAWWGAILATVVLAWDVYKWRQSRADLGVSASPNMQPVEQLKGSDGAEKYIFVEAVNNSDRTTTLTHLVVKHYKTFFARVRRKPSMQAVVIRPGGSQGLPYELGPGKRWTGLIDQADLEKKLGGSGHLFCGVLHSGSKKPVLVRARLDKPAF